MKYRKLRIAFSVTCGIACVLLIALWVRSYGRFDYAILRVAKFHGVEWRSQDGRLVTSPFQSDQPLNEFWKYSAYPKMRMAFKDQDGRDMLAGVGFKAVRWGHGSGVVLPYWALALFFGSLAYIFAIRWRFSLRTLLIGMTVVAVLLAIVIWAIR